MIVFSAYGLVGVLLSGLYVWSGAFAFAFVCLIKEPIRAIFLLLR